MIWCEDSGYLAYYEAPDEVRSTTAGFFDAGDYIEFDIMDNRVPLRACNAQTLRSAQRPRVLQTLQARGGVPTQAEMSAGEMIELADRRTEDRPGKTRSEVNRRG